LQVTLAEKIKWLQEKKDQDELRVEVDHFDCEIAMANTKVEELSATVRSMERHHLKEVDVLIKDRDTLRTTCSE
jgi:lipopolysaccharide biosynthesis regulator YciM